MLSGCPPTAEKEEVVVDPQDPASARPPHRPQDQTPHTAAAGWQWVPVRLDLHRRLTEQADGAVSVDPSGGPAEQESILRVLREQSVPAVYSAAERTIDLMLPVTGPGADPRVARADAEGRLTLGAGLEDFMEELLAFPGLEYASWQTGPSPQAAPTAVAEVRLPVSALRRRLLRTRRRGPVQLAAPAAGWSLAAGTDYEDLVELLDAVDAPAVLLDTDGEHRALTVLGQDADPVTLEWGPVRTSVATYPEDSPAGRLQAQVSGLASQPRRDAARRGAVAALAERFRLDAPSARRLAGYAEDATGRYAPESVLQLLGLPEDAAKILDGRRTPADLPEHEVIAPEQGPVGATARRVRDGAGTLLDRVRGVRTDQNPDSMSPGVGAGSRAGSIGPHGPALPEHRLPARLVRGAAVSAAAALGWGVGTWLGRRNR